MRGTYVVLIPENRDNPTDAYLVVNVEEWVEIALHEKKDYTFTSEHGDYTSASDKRDQLNNGKETPSWAAASHTPTETPRVPSVTA